MATTSNTSRRDNSHINQLNSNHMKILTQLFSKTSDKSIAALRKLDSDYQAMVGKSLPAEQISSTAEEQRRQAFAKASDSMSPEDVEACIQTYLRAEVATTVISEITRLHGHKCDSFLSDHREILAAGCLGVSASIDAEVDKLIESQSRKLADMGLGRVSFEGADKLRDLARQFRERAENVRAGNGHQRHHLAAAIKFLDDHGKS